MSTHYNDSKFMVEYEKYFQIVFSMGSCGSELFAFGDNNNINISLFKQTKLPTNCHHKSVNLSF